MKDAHSCHEPIRFGAFELDRESGELRQKGLKIRLQEQPLQVLQLLLEEPGRVVTREKLRERIWPSDTFVDFDHGLYNAVKKLRDALGDSADSPRYIETLSRRGYRFVAPVNRSSLVSQGGELSAAKLQDSIAVLPFINLSADSENEFFADGITEEIINALARIEQLHVVARSSAFSFKGKHVDLRIIGEQLNVHTILEGSLRRSGSHLRITAQLINVADGYHLWSERYDREMKDVFDIQDEIARSIVGQLKLRLAESGREPLVKVRTNNLDAYQLYLKGRVLLPRRGSAIPRALECFERAVNLDVNYAEAWAGVADSYTTLGYYGVMPPDATMTKAIIAARRAVELGPSLAEAHNALGMASLMGAWDKVEAEREFLRALELNPRYIQARDWYGLFHLQFAQGRMEEGIAQTRQAMENDPLSSYATTLFGLACSFSRRHAHGIQACQRAVELDSESFLARYSLCTALYMGGRFTEALDVGESAVAMSGQNSWVMLVLATTLADSGKGSEARAIHAELMARAGRCYVPPSSLAITASAANLCDEAIRHASEAFEMRDPGSQIWFSEIWPGSARLRSDPRFDQVAVDKGWLRY